LLDGFDVAVLDEAEPVPAFEGLSDASGWRCYVLRSPQCCLMQLCRYYYNYQKNFYQ